ncbi:uncharacterized protein [Spinacia oleracea]|uniref:Uncharacterized protein n=1 Tax=Spinacia oleracea TaxID=3562 RepID=A0ABM3RCE3_SPIOL|nr:uncharacterized protein LOC130468007 [Spinacia oleracea]
MSSLGLNNIFLCFLVLLGRQHLDMSSLGLAVDGTPQTNESAEDPANAYRTIADVVGGRRASSRRTVRGGSSAASRTARGGGSVASRTSRGGGSAGITAGASTSTPRSAPVSRATPSISASAWRGQTTRGGGNIAGQRRPRPETESVSVDVTRTAADQLQSAHPDQVVNSSISEQVEIVAEEQDVPFVQRPGKRICTGESSRSQEQAQASAPANQSTASLPTSSAALAAYLEEQLRLPESSVPAFVNIRNGEFLEKEAIDVRPAVNPELAACFSPAPISDDIFAPHWDVRANESLYASFPEKGGTLAYRMLKGLTLPADRPLERVYTPGANACQKVLEAGVAVKELCDFFFFYQRKHDEHLALLEEKDKQIRDLTLENERASSSLTIANANVQTISVERDNLASEVVALRLTGENLAKAQAEVEAERKRTEDLAEQLSFVEQRHADELAELRLSVQKEVAAAVREFCRSDAQYALLTQRYDGGWKAASLIIKHKYPQFDWSLIEEDWLAGLHLTILKELREAEAAEGHAVEPSDVPDFCVENIHPGDLPFSDEDDVAGNDE